MVGAYFTWISPFYTGPILAAIAAFFVCAAGNIINDVLDINIDRINRPYRIIVSGGISKEKALRLALVFSVSALAISLFTNAWVFVTVLVALILVGLYNFRAKRTPVLGNLVVAMLAGLTFVTGGLAVDRLLAFTLPGPLIPAFFGFLFHLAREIVKDVEDIEGDRAFGVKTLPQVLGVSRALLVALGVFFVFSLASFIPVFQGWLGRTYEIIAVYLIELPTLLILIFVWGNPTPQMLRTGSLVLKGGMALGILALILGR
jgi:geranylgeranylglycerol-phosphate geranylgeranyltransferase